MYQLYLNKIGGNNQDHFFPILVSRPFRDPATWEKNPVLYNYFSHELSIISFDFRLTLNPAFLYQVFLISENS